MEPREIYYADNSQIIDEESCNWIGNTVLVGDNIVWQEEVPEITVNYADSAIDTNSSPTENEEYLTASADESNDNTTQYFSILDSTYQNEEGNENTENENLSVSNDAEPNLVLNISVQDKNEMIIPDSEPHIEESGHISEDHYELHDVKDIIDTNVQALSEQVVLYRIADSDELYAVQVADDGSGNFQRYRYKVRQTLDGQYEAIPGTIELQDGDIDNNTTEKKCVPEEDHSKTSYFIKCEPDHTLSPDEHISSEGQLEYDNLESSEEEYGTPEYLDQEFDTPDYLINSLNENLYAEKEDDPHSTEKIDENSSDLNLSKSPLPLMKINNVLGNIESDEGDIDDTDYDEVNSFLLDELERKIMEANSTPKYLKQKIKKTKTINAVSTPVELYDRVKKHITENETGITIFKDDENVSFLVVDGKEKQKMSITQIKTSFANCKNTRSILKSNCVVVEDEDDNKDCEQKKNVNISNKKHCTPIRMLNTSKTTVAKDTVTESPRDNVEIHLKSSIKSIRQPRKQTITPIDRMGSEIIVQQISFAYDDENTDVAIPVKRKYNTLQEVYRVSDDSDPDYTDKPKPRKKKTKYSRGSKIRQRKMSSEVTIIDSDLTSDNDSVIEVLSDQENNKKSVINSIKKNCAELNKIDSNKKNISVNIETQRTNSTKSEKSVETPKNDEINVEKTILDKGYVQVVEKEIPTTHLKNCGNIEISINVHKEDSCIEKVTKPAENCVIKKNKIKCPVCPKTFPRQINLKTHMNIHSARRVLRSKRKSPLKEDIKKIALNEKLATSSTNKAINELYCAKCKLKFSSQIQLARHQVVHSNKTILRAKSISPKKCQFMRTTIATRKVCATMNKLNSAIPKLTKTPDKDNKTIKPTKESFTCEHCSKKFSQCSLLAAHRSSHKAFPCINCKKTFPTKSLLDDHLRKNCVSVSSRRSSIRNKINSKLTSHKCDICKLTFSTITALQKHKEDSHKTKTANNIKSVNIIRDSTKRTKKPHGGVPASLKLQKAFDIMKLKS